MIPFHFSPAWLRAEAKRAVSWWRTIRREAEAISNQRPIDGDFFKKLFVLGIRHLTLSVGLDSDHKSMA